MKCNKIKIILGAYMDGELSDKQAKKVEYHLADCSACTWELKSFRRVDALGQWMAETESSRSLEGYWHICMTDLRGKLGRLKQYHQRGASGFFNSYLRSTLDFAAYWLKKLSPGLVAVMTVLALAVAINHVFKQPSPITIIESPKTVSETPEITSKQIAEKQDVVKKTSEDNQAEKITINFYLKEHENTIMQASYPPQPIQKSVELGYEDVFYYNAVRGGAGQGETGVFLRVPRRSGYSAPKQQPQSINIAKDYNLSLQDAQNAASFRIIAPQTLYPGYLLESIKKVEGTGCLHLVYTDGINTVSLFEQAFKNSEKLHSSDFNEYVMYSKGGDEPANIISWNSADVSFTLIGSADFSHLMGITRKIQEGYLEK